MIWKTLPFPTLLKADESRRELHAIITAPVMDLDGEYCDTEGSWPFFEKTMEQQLAASGGQNCLPLREMHQLIAVGKTTHLEMRPDGSIYGRFQVVSDDAWAKVVAGVFTGISQGGRIVKRYERDGKRFYISDPMECSLVDKPALPIATFDYISKNGSTELRKFAKGASSMNADQFLVAARHHEELSGVNKKLADDHATAAKLHKSHADFLRKCAANPGAAPKAGVSTFGKTSNLDDDFDNVLPDASGGLRKAVNR